MLIVMFGNQCSLLLLATNQLLELSFLRSVGLGEGRQGGLKGFQVGGLDGDVQGCSKFLLINMGSKWFLHSEVR